MDQLIIRLILRKLIFILSQPSIWGLS